VWRGEFASAFNNAGAGTSIRCRHRRNRVRLIRFRSRISRTRAFRRLASVRWHGYSAEGVTMITQLNRGKPVGIFGPWQPGLLLLGLLLPSGGGNAAPICLQTQAIAPQCIYYDANQCRRDANRQGGICSANPREIRDTPNVGQYCLLTSERVSLCVYSDRASCDADAARQNAACTYATGRRPSGAPDPYANPYANPVGEK
jgi:hypothetical protein